MTYTELLQLLVTATVSALIAGLGTALRMTQTLSVRMAAMERDLMWIRQTLGTRKNSESDGL